MQWLPLAGLVHVGPRALRGRGQRNTPMGPLGAALRGHNARNNRAATGREPPYLDTANWRRCRLAQLPFPHGVTTGMASLKSRRANGYSLWRGLKARCSPCGCLAPTGAVGVSSDCGRRLSRDSLYLQAVQLHATRFAKRILLESKRNKPPPNARFSRIEEGYA